MELNGRHTVNATPMTIWAMLMDTDTLSKIIPGISRLEKTGENRFNSFIDLKFGLVNGTFHGDLQMEEVNEPKSFLLKVHQSSSIGKANADIRIELTPVTETETEIRFDGNVKLAGLLAGIGQRVIGGVANVLSKQFFANLDHELAKQQAA
jgi:carbon monoxide dehydrogenase subunit G